MLYFRFNFDYGDSPTEVIREVAVFANTTLQPGLPAGQQYFLPADIDTSGYMMVLERFPKFTRSNSVRQQFEFVVEW